MRVILFVMLFMTSQFCILPSEPFIHVNNATFTNGYDKKIHTILPNLIIQLIYPTGGWYGEENAAKCYQNALEKYGIRSGLKNNLTGSKGKNEIDLLLAYTSDVTGKPSEYTYMFLHWSINYHCQGFAELWKKQKKYKRLLQIGKNDYFPDVSRYGAQQGFYFTVSRTNFTKTSLEDASLFFCGGGWDNRYNKCLSILDTKDFFNWYGPKSLSNKKSYKGYSNNIIESIEQHKIALILHGPQHLQDEEPTLRIFEAASAGAVIISDRHPFIVDNFGDSIFYVNQNDSDEKIAHDIIKHYKWIKRNPTKALNLAQRAHTIFMEKFTLEDQILKFMQMHQETLILDGFHPLPPRESFSHLYKKADLPLLNKLLKILMPQHFVIKNLTNVKISNLLSLSLIVNRSRIGETIKFPEGMFLRNEGIVSNDSHLKFDLKTNECIAPQEDDQYSLNNGIYLTSLKENPNVAGYLLEWNESSHFTLNLIDETTL